MGLPVYLLTGGEDNRKTLQVHTTVGQHNWRLSARTNARTDPS